MKTKPKQVVSVRSLRFVLGCVLAAAAFAISLSVYNSLKAALFFAVLFLVVGAVKIPDSLIDKRFLPVLYSGWLVLSAFVTLGLSQFCQNEVLPERGLFVTILGILLIIGLFLIPVVFTL